MLDVATFEAVGRALDANRSYHGARARHPRLLTGRMICGGCGAGIHVRNRGGSSVQHYRCATAHPTYATKPGFIRPPCAAPVHEAEDLDAVVWAEVERLLTNPRLLREAAGLGAQAEKSPVADIGTIEKELRGLDRQHQNLLRLFRKGLASESDLEKQMVEVQSLRKAAEHRLSVAQARRDATASRIATRLDLEARVKSITTGLTGATLEEKRELMAAIFPKREPFGISLYPDGKIEAVGCLPALPDQTTSSSRAASATARASTS